MVKQKFVKSVAKHGQGNNGIIGRVLSMGLAMQAFQDGLVLSMK